MGRIRAYRPFGPIPPKNEVLICPVRADLTPAKGKGRGVSSAGPPKIIMPLSLLFRGRPRPATSIIIEPCPSAGSAVESATDGRCG